MNTHKPQVCYKHVFNKFLLNSIRNKEQTKIKKTVSADYGYSKLIFMSDKFSDILTRMGEINIEAIKSTLSEQDMANKMEKVCTDFLK